MSAAPYPPIGDHGVIGDLQSAALVATNGSIDWFCAPRFDSPPVFAAVLDATRGGRFAITPTAEAVTRQMYLPESATLVTRFLSADSVAEVTDVMPIHDPATATDRRRILRVIRGLRGRTTFAVEVAPAFDFGRVPHTASGAGRHVRFSTRDFGVDVTASVDLAVDGAAATGTVEVGEGDVAWLVLESGAEERVVELTRSDVDHELMAASAFWHDWVAKGRYRGRWREMITRSAITLKLMTYAPTGAMVAAPSTSLPERIGGERNWDYRFTWVRDASFSMRALLALGYDEEAIAFSHWMRQRIDERRDRQHGPLQIMYRVDGDTELTEENLTDLDGYRHSRPVRIGNGAVDQLQLDIYGELLNALQLLDHYGHFMSDRAWKAIVDVIDWVCENWDQTEAGIWESRGGPQHFVYGRMMVWVAIDRALRIAAHRSFPAPIARWTTVRDLIYDVVHERGFNEDLQAFVQFDGGDVLDAAILLMPLNGFISPTDPRWLSTLDAIRRTLVTDSLVYRYDPRASPDGLTGTEGTFSLCTFWYVAALARSGFVDEARLTFDKMLTHANHLGLFSEEVGVTGEQLGNFPQAFTHLSLIVAALELDRALDGDD
ncbi:MAG: glycoside hydrolase family 15 protein [Actinomycetota bacterium]